MKAYFINKVLATTVVGSYPVVKGTGIKAIFDPLKPAVETAVADQLAAGIDIISDGQVRGDMIHAFSGKLPGIKGQDVIGKIQPASGAITAADTKYARSKSLYVKGIITDWSKPLLDGGLGPGSSSHYLVKLMQLAAVRYKIDLKVPFEDLPPKHQHIFVYT